MTNHIPSRRSRFWTVTIFSVLYVLLGSYAITRISHPFLPGGFIAFNMVIIVCVGILFGRFTGLLSGVGAGILSTIAALLFPEVDDFLLSLGSILPLGIMGYLAGATASRYGTFVSSLTIIIGHALNMTAYTLMGLFLLAQYDLLFWKAIGYETLIDIILINITCSLFLISFPYIKRRW